MSRCARSRPAAAALARELLAHVVPDLLGVDQHPVQVEDDRAVDHSAEYRRSRWTSEVAAARARARAPRRRRTCGRRPRAGRRCARRASRPRPRAGAGRRRARRSRPRARSAGRCARSAARGASWSPERIDTPHSPAPSQHLVERRLARDRDADERRLERQREQRRDRQPGAAPSSSATTTETPDGQRRKSRPLPGSRVSCTARGYWGGRRRLVRRGTSRRRARRSPRWRARPRPCRTGAARCPATSRPASRPGR